jgi:hypothetical protein
MTTEANEFTQGLEAGDDRVLETGKEGPEAVVAISLGGVRGYRFYDEAKANALLFAAATEMFAFLMESVALDVHEESCSRCDLAHIECSAGLRLEANIVRLKALALAKVKGLL